MSNKITTLHPSGDLNTNVYPNILSDNIPSNAITQAKINDGAISTSKMGFHLYEHTYRMRAYSGGSSIGDLYFKWLSTSQDAITLSDLVDRNIIMYGRVYDSGNNQYANIVYDISYDSLSEDYYLECTNEEDEPQIILDSTSPLTLLSTRTLF